ncbi:MAG: IS91 family transposase [Deltaproteobacteria bacterium]|nr:IS91 family transposase [Deltaproteobacteria bacterium]
MSELADIFRRYGPEYIERFGENMLPSHGRAIHDIIDCRTEVFGGHLVKCGHCQTLDYAYHSCKNRACPKCHGNDTRRWLEKRRAELLETVYFHVVFTLPSELREVVRKNQQTLYSILLRAAAYALLKLAADPKYVGARIGMLAVLHTWTSSLAFHPHAHFLVPGSGATSDGRCRHAVRKKFLVPVQALSPIFRAKFMEMARKAMPDAKFPAEIWQKDWVVYAKPAVQGSDKVLRYLGRYVHRIAITNNRILAGDDGQVTFRYKQRRQQKQKRCSQWKTMTLPATQFMARFLQHVVPQGFHKVRYYGIWSPANRAVLNLIRQSLANEGKADDNHVADMKDNGQAGQQAGLCRFCKQGYMVVIGVIPRKRRQKYARSPP